MKLSEFIGVLAVDIPVVIWHNDDLIDPVFEGSVFDIPYGWLDSDIVPKDDVYEGIYLSADLDAYKETNPKFNHRAGLVITIDG